MINGKKCTAVVLAAGTGSRMGGAVAKQYMLLAGKPILWYSLNAVEQSAILDECILMVGAGDVAYVRQEIVQKYGFSKVSAVAAGGAERYLTVGKALQVIRERFADAADEEGYLFIHDGARPFLTEDMIERLAVGVEVYHACVAAMPSKDTVKIADTDGFATQTPDRRTVWNVQTPQVFELPLIAEAYERLEAQGTGLQEQGIAITDDAGVVEHFTDYRIRLVEGAYTNLKITTPEDLIVAEALLKAYQNEQ